MKDLSLILLLILFDFDIFVLSSFDSDPTLQSVTHESYAIDGSSKLGKYFQSAVAIDNAICSNIGRRILENNGTTVDAALAAGICNSVMNAHSMGIGGGCVMVIYSKWDFIQKYSNWLKWNYFI